MICTQCGAPARPIDLGDAHLIRCRPCALCWFADRTAEENRGIAADALHFAGTCPPSLFNADDIAVIRDQADAVHEAAEMFERQMVFLKGAAAAATEDMLRALSRQLDGAQRAFTRQARAADAIFLERLTDRIVERAPSDAAVMLTEALARRSKSGAARPMPLRDR